MNLFKTIARTLADWIAGPTHASYTCRCGLTAEITGPPEYVEKRLVQIINHRCPAERPTAKGHPQD
ncbi:hypothetical protein [Streptomyces sp. NPDC093109]|uniref:hypothetical protein n=1 Tax=Streptomyces sp. NPDC093109 TaxID=3154977 RepID=UPI00344CE8BC